MGASSSCTQADVKLPKLLSLRKLPSPKSVRADTNQPLNLSTNLSSDVSPHFQGGTSPVSDDDDVYKVLILEDVEVMINEESDWTLATVLLDKGKLEIKSKDEIILIEINLVNFPEIRLQEYADHTELSVAINDDESEIKVKIINDEEAKRWLQFVRYHLMTQLGNEDVFTDKIIDMTDHGQDVVSTKSFISQESYRLSLGAILQDNMRPIDPPHLSVVILVVGTRGDVQPFINLGKQLQKHGHRVRIATHAEYRTDVIIKGLEFYPLAGDPRKLSEHMVKTSGRLVPDLLNSEERKMINPKLKMLKDICHSCYPACIHPDPEDNFRRPFLADAIIANPVSLGHIHCAQALSIPLHIMFPQPWSPTRCFPHPLSNIGFDSTWSSKNYYSYLMVDEFMWLGLGTLINSFRKNVLRLPTIKMHERAESLLNQLNVPISHMWSPSFVPKCRDWPSHVDVVGEFRDMEAGDDPATAYSPAPQLLAFLDEGPKPFYIGFGSMVIEDPVSLVTMIIEAAKSTGFRILLQSGWTSYGDNYERLSDEVMVISSMPHDYLFTKVAGVIHHGGAGTTSAGLRCGNPTFICPFFGDQFFWAEMVYRVGVGPKGCPMKEMTVQRLIDGFNVMHCEETVEKVKCLAEHMMQENGVEMGADSFYRHLPLERMVCDVSIFNGQKSHLAKTYCCDCRLKMCEKVDAVLHRATSSRSDHKRVPYKTYLWGKSFVRRSQEEHDFRSGARVNLQNSVVRSAFNRMFSGRYIPDATDSILRSTMYEYDIHHLSPEDFAIEQASARAQAFLRFWDKLDIDGKCCIDKNMLGEFLTNKDDVKLVLALVELNGDKALTFTELAWIMSQKPSFQPNSPSI